MAAAMNLATKADQASSKFNSPADLALITCHVRAASLQARQGRGENSQNTSCAYMLFLIVLPTVCGLQFQQKGLAAQALAGHTAAGQAVRQKAARSESHCTSGSLPTTFDRTTRNKPPLSHL